MFEEGPYAGAFEGDTYVTMLEAGLGVSTEYPVKPICLSSCEDPPGLCWFPWALPRRKANHPSPTPISAAAGIPTPSPILADEDRSEELSDDADDSDATPDASTVVAGLGLEEEAGIDAMLVAVPEAAVEALVETLLVVESADEILKNTVRSLGVVAPVTKSIIMKTGEMERSFPVATIQLRVFLL